MTTTAVEPLPTMTTGARRPRAAGALAALAGRRASLTSRTPRQIVVPLIGPAVLALVAAPALDAATGGLHSRIDYTAFVCIGTVALLVPLTCVFAGLSVLVDRESGAQRELLAAPVPRAYLVLGNLAVATVLAALQVVVLIGLSALSGAHFTVTAAGLGWFAAATLLFTVFMYGVAELLASRFDSPEDYVGATPAVAVLPFFLAGALFPISAMPAALTAIAKVLPLTHALALMRYGFVDHRGAGLHDIWGAGNTTTQAWLSLAVVALAAVAMTVVAIRSFSKAAVR